MFPRIAMKAKTKRLNAVILDPESVAEVELFPLPTGPVPLPLAASQEAGHELSAVQSAQLPAVESNLSPYKH